MLNKVGETAEWVSLKFNAKKCATLHTLTVERGEKSGKSVLHPGE